MDAGGKEVEKQLLYSSVTLVDLPGALQRPSDDGVKKKEDVAITKMLAKWCLSPGGRPPTGGARAGAGAAAASKPHSVPGLAFSQ